MNIVLIIKDLFNNKGPWFNHKGLNSKKSLLIKKDKLVYNENKLASIFNENFIIVTSDLELRNPPTKKLMKILSHSSF